MAWAPPAPPEGAGGAMARVGPGEAAASLLAVVEVEAPAWPKLVWVVPAGPTLCSEAEAQRRPRLRREWEVHVELGPPRRAAAAAVVAWRHRERRAMREVVEAVGARGRGRWKHASHSEAVQAVAEEEAAAAVHHRRQRPVASGSPRP